MLPTQPNYRAYLLRLWRVGEAVGPDETPVWRASLEDPRTSERLAFASLERLCTFLFDQTTQANTEAHSPTERRMLCKQLLKTDDAVE